MYFITTIQKRKKKYRLNGNYFSFCNEYRRLRAGTGQFIQHCFGQLCQQPSLPAWRLWQTKFKVMSRNMVFQLAKLASGCSTLLFFFSTRKITNSWHCGRSPSPRCHVQLARGYKQLDNLGSLKLNDKSSDSVTIITTE